MKHLIIASCGMAALPLVCLPANAEPITSDWIDQAAAFPKPVKPETPKKTEEPTDKAAKVEPEDLISNGPRKKEKNGRSITAIRKASGAKQEDAADEVPEIPWELIELALQREKQSKSAHREADVVINSEYQQLIIDSLPDFALDIAYSQPTNNIPILDFLRAQTSAISVEIATYTSDIAIQDDTIAMASNGNLDEDDDVGEPAQKREGTKLPSLLKKLFFWGLGLLVLYTVVEALFTKVLRRDFQGPAGPDGRDLRPMRKRGFGRSRRRHRSA